MLKELEDEEILNYLMTSDFTEGLTPDEFKFLLYKFRYFYRIINGKNELLKTNYDGKVREFELEKSGFSKRIDDILTQKAEIENKFDFLKSRRLSLKERLSGKIIIKDETQ
jgi:hypothetical protein